MAELKQGSVTVQLPERVTLHPRAGKLSAKEAVRELKGYASIGECCQMTAVALEQHGERVSVPQLNLTALKEDGQDIAQLAQTISDLEVTLTILKQQHLLMTALAHRKLLRALAFVRAHEKFDPRVAEAFPHLISYFAKVKKAEKAAKPELPQETEA